MDRSDAAVLRPTFALVSRHGGGQSSDLWYGISNSSPRSHSVGYYDSGCSIQIPPGKPPVANGGLKCPKDTSPGTGNWCQRVTGVMNAGSPPDAFCR